MHEMTSRKNCPHSSGEVSACPWSSASGTAEAPCKHPVIMLLQRMLKGASFQPIVLRCTSTRLIATNASPEQQGEQPRAAAPARAAVAPPGGAQRPRPVPPPRGPPGTIMGPDGQPLKASGSGACWRARAWTLYGCVSVLNNAR